MCCCWKWGKLMQKEQHLSSIVAPWANFKAEFFQNTCLKWCGCTDHIFRGLKGAPSEALCRLVHHWCDTKQKGAKSLLKFDVSILCWREQLWATVGFEPIWPDTSAMVFQPSYMPDHWTNLTLENSTSWRYLKTRHVQRWQSIVIWRGSFQWQSGATFLRHQRAFFAQGMSWLWGWI